MEFEKEHKNDKLLGDFGEKYVIMKLSEIGLDSVKLPSSFDFDIYTNNHLRIEVKISNLNSTILKQFKGNKTYSYHKQFWGFNNYSRNKKIVRARNRACDFFILLCKEGDKIVSYIIPKGIFKQRRSVIIYKNGISYFEQFRENWKLLKN